MARQSGLGEFTLGQLGSGMVWQGSQGKARRGPVGHGQVRNGALGIGMVWFGSLGQERSGPVGHGKVWHGLAVEA